MKRCLPSSALAACLLMLASCESTGGPGGATVMYPTVSEMDRMEQQWGLPPRQVRPKLRPLEPGESPRASTSYSEPAAPPPAMLAPAPDPIQEPSPAPEPVDPDTLQRLR